LQNAIANITTNGTIYLAGGTYNYASTILIQGKNGTSARIKVFANGGTPVLNFSAMAENSSNRGIVLDANYWHFRGLIIQEAGDNGLLLAGNNNIIEDCIFRRNHDTGLQLSRYNTNANTLSQWPSNNLILNCESFDNQDSDNEDADGFAAKLTSGTGNVFQGCVSHHNIDDGWDLYTKSATGPIGAVTLIECIAHSNGVLTNGSSSGNGDKNGFKMGGEDIAVNHIMRRCIAFNNGKHGITYNRNLGSIEVSNCTGYNNEERNFNFDGGNHVFKNNLSFQTGSNDRLIGNSAFPNAFDNDDNWGFTITSADFLTLSQGPNSDPTSNGFLNLATNSDAINAGVNTPGISYSSTAPDLGAVESGGTTPPPPTFTLSLSASPSTGGSVSANPSSGSYNSGEVVTLTASANSGYVFSNWSGDASGSNTSLNVTMNSNKTITAVFTSTGGGGGGGGGGNTNLGANLAITGPGAGSDGSSKASGSSYNNVRDGDDNTYWSPSSTTNEEITVKWSGQVSSNTIILKEVGNRVSGWQLETREGVVLGSGSSIGASLQVDYPDVSTDKIFLYLFSASATPQIGEFEVYDATGSGGGGTTYNLSVANAPSNGGSISLSPAGGTYAAGTVVTLTASANSGYGFDGWSGAASGSSATTTVTMNSNLSATASFSVQASTLQLQENASGFCAVDGSVDSDNGGFTGSGFANTANTAGSGIEWAVSAPSAGSYTLQWRFANGGSTNRSGRVLVNGSQQVGNVDLNGTGSWTTWATSGTATVSLAAGDNLIRLEANGGDGLANIDWIEVTGNGPSAGACAGGGGTTNYTLTVNNSPSSGGSVSLSPAGGTYAAGTVVTLTASPSSGYNFVNWSGAASGSSTTTTVTMSSNLSVTATYQQAGGGGGNANFAIAGYATLNGGTTGGAGGTYVVVSTGTALQDAINNKGSQPLTIYVNGTITPGNSSGISKIDLKDVSDISVLGMGSGGELDGIGIKIWRASNIIIRNLEVHNVLIGDKDAISIEGPSDHIWVDHCELYAEYQGVGKDYYDGLLDLKRDVDNVTFSWNYLHDSWKCSLSGSSESDTYNRQVTYHHNIYENMNSRLPLFRSGEGHIYNCYYKDVVSTTINSRIGACIRVENNYFEHANNPWVSAYSDVLGGVETMGNTLVNSPFDYSNSDINQALSCTLSVPYSYSSTLNSSSSVPALLTQYAGVGVLNLQPPAAKTTDIELKAAQVAWQESLRLAPNPNQGQFRLSFDLPTSDHVQIQLINSLGQQVNTLVNQRFAAGHHEVLVDQHTLAADVYMLVATSRQGTAITRMVVH
jgi:pectate lyase